MPKPSIESVASSLLSTESSLLACVINVMIGALRRTVDSKSLVAIFTIHWYFGIFYGLDTLFVEGQLDLTWYLSQQIGRTSFFIALS